MTAHTPLTPDLAAARRTLYANADRNRSEYKSRAARLPRDGLYARYARYPLSDNQVMIAIARARRAWKHEEVLAQWRERGVVPAAQEARAAA